MRYVFLLRVAEYLMIKCGVWITTVHLMLRSEESLPLNKKKLESQKEEKIRNITFAKMMITSQNPNKHINL
jgi:hypothetical protein